MITEDENGVVETPVPETPTRTSENIQEEMMEATSSNNWERFDELEKEMFSLDAEESQPVEDAPATPVEEPSESDQPELAPTEESVVTEQPVTPPAVDNTFSDMKKIIEEAQRKTLEAQAQQVVAPVPVTPEVQPEVLSIPVAPVYPDIPSDPSLWEEEHIAKQKAYQAEQIQFNADTSAYLASMNSTTQAILDSQKQQKLQQIQAQKVTDQENARNSHWSNIRDLQSSVPSLKTDVDIVDVHNGIDTFGNDLALLHGYTAGTTPAEADAFNRAKNSLLVKYRSGEQGIADKVSSAGLQKPTGFDTYMNISEVNSFRDEMIKSGNLGTKATFRDAYLLKSERDGTLAESFNDIAVREREQSNVDTANKLKESQQAVRTPSAVAPASQQSATPVASADGDRATSLSSDEVNFINEINKNPGYATTSPERMAAWEQLETKMKTLGYI